MSILDALKNLVIKRGGTPKGSNIAEVIDDLAETSSGGGSGNMILNLDSLPKPAIDGTPVVDANIFVLNPEDESSNIPLPTDHIFVHDFPEGDYPLFLTINVEDVEDIGWNAIKYNVVDMIMSFECRAAKTFESGTESPCLLNDVTIIQYASSNDSRYYFFPTTAQFGRRQLSRTQ